MNAKDDILSRIRAAGANSRPGGDAGLDDIPRLYDRQRTIPEGLVARFCARVADYRANVERVPAPNVPDAVIAALGGFRAKRVSFAPGLPQEWRDSTLRAGLAVVLDRPGAPLDVDALQRLDAVVTGSAVGIAETGTVVLDGGPSCGRRALTLVPDAHVCIVAATDIVDDVPSAVARLRPTSPLTWISGPSATSDIELNRVEGVHGPRRLHVLVVED